MISVPTEKGKTMNNKKILLVLLSVLLIVSLCSCGWNESETDMVENDNRMVLIFNDGWCLIYADTETGCQYLSRSNCGTCLMVDADGKPLLYDFG